ncbi:MAG: DUF4838 domain-containing protein [Armatimonadota bacterium]|jgi:hypothetical protein
MIRQAVVTVVCLMLVAGVGCSEMTLVSEGQAVATIVTADRPSGAARDGARMLQDYLRRISGAELAVVGASRAPDGARILVGSSPLTEAHGYVDDELALEQAIVRVHGDDLVVIGDDATPEGRALMGTRHAAVMLLREIGVRWLWPGELGTVTPELATITLADDLQLDWTPLLLKRGLRSAGYNDRVQRGLDALGWSAEDFQAMHARDIGDWYAAHRIGGSFAGSYGHAYGGYWERYHEEHPEWFALQPDGTRDQGNIGNRSRLCVSNPELIAHIAREKIAELRERPDVDCVSISPNDGGAATFCTCEACEAWDHPDGPIIQSYWPDVENRRREHVSLSDRYARFYNEIAKLVAEEHPDRLLGAYAYSAYRTVPVAQTLEPNILIGFVGVTYVNREGYEADIATFEGWAERSSQIFWRPNLLNGGMGFPQNFARPLARDVAAMAERGLTVTDFDCQYQHWALKGLTYYTLAEMLADPGADPDAIIDDYCAAGFGPAAREIGAYFDALEAVTGRIHEDSAFLGRRENNEVLAAYYDDETLAGLQAHLDAAREAAADDATVLERIDFLQVAVDYARVNRDFVLARHAVRSGEADRREEMEAAELAREQFYQRVGLSWAINSAYLKFYGF